MWKRARIWIQRQAYIGIKIFWDNWWYFVATAWFVFVFVLVWQTKVDPACGNGIDWIILVLAISPIAPFMVKYLRVKKLGPVEFFPTDIESAGSREGSFITKWRESGTAETIALRQARDLLSKEQFSDAIPLLFSIIERSQTCWPALTNIGFAYGEGGKQQDFDRSITYSTRALLIEPRNFAAWMNLGLALKHRGVNSDWPRCVECFEKCYIILSHEFNPQLAVERGKSHLFAAQIHESLGNHNRYHKELVFALRDLEQYPAIQEQWLRETMERLEKQNQKGNSLPMKYGARNQLVGKVTDVKKGNVMCQVKLEIPAGSHMASVMTLDSLDELGIKVGDSVKVVVKAVNVLLVKE